VVYSDISSRRIMMALDPITLGLIAYFGFNVVKDYIPGLMTREAKGRLGLQEKQLSLQEAMFRSETKGKARALKESRKMTKEMIERLTKERERERVDVREERELQRLSETGRMNAAMMMEMIRSMRANQTPSRPVGGGYSGVPASFVDLLR
jgi:hypothetical protein